MAALSESALMIVMGFNDPVTTLARSQGYQHAFLVLNPTQPVLHAVHCSSKLVMQLFIPQAVIAGTERLAEQNCFRGHF